jgi:hypothetical protein
MTEIQKRQAIKWYFTPKKKYYQYAAYAAGGGILLILLKLTLLGILGILIGAGIIGYIFYKKEPTDAEIDAWLDEALSKYNRISYNKLEINPDEYGGTPIYIKGPILWSIQGISDDEILWKKGKDGYARFSTYKITIIHFMEQYIGSYAFVYNFVRDVALNEEADEFFYRHITGVAMKESATNYTLPNGEKLVNSQMFRLSTTGGDGIEVLVNSSILQKFTNSMVPTTEVERAVQAIRKALRDKDLLVGGAKGV